MAAVKDSAGWKVVGGLVAVAAGLAARKSVAAIWKSASGKHPPDVPESPRTSWAEAAGWAVVSGATVSLARLIATRRAATLWARSTGELPPQLETEEAA